MTRRGLDGSAEGRQRDHSPNRSANVDRRRFLRLGGVAAGASVLAGCSSLLGNSGDGNATTTGGADGANATGGAGGGNGTGNASSTLIGSGRQAASLGGTPMEEMPPLRGKLQVYSGRGEALVGELVSFLRDRYPNFDLEMRYQGSTELANQILTEGESSPADVFFSVNAGSLGLLADRGRTRKLPQNVRSMVPKQFRDPKGMWVGTSGRARSIPYNTNRFNEGQIPDDIFAFPDQQRFQGVMGWAPSYGSFQAFVTAMRVLSGEQRTRRWLSGMQQQGIESYSDEFLIAQAVADGEIQVGFTNHYYIQRVLDARPDAPLATAFTKNDAGSVFNVAGAEVLNTAESPRLATNFVRHLLSAEAQEYFARTTKEYPLVPGVKPAGSLPPIGQLNPPNGLDLTQLSNLEPTVRLMREVGLDV